MPRKDNLKFGIADKLRGQKCRRVAFFALQGKSPMYTHFNEELATYNLHSPFGFQYMLHETKLTPRILELMWALPKEKRPDSIVVADNNLTAEVMRGLKRLRVRVPEDAELVTHCHWKENRPPVDILPSRNLGYDLYELIANTFVTFTAAQNGGSYPREISIPPRSSPLKQN